MYHHQLLGNLRKAIVENDYETFSLLLAKNENLIINNQSRHFVCSLMFEARKQGHTKLTENLVKLFKFDHENLDRYSLIYNGDVRFTNIYLRNDLRLEDPGWDLNLIINCMFQKNDAGSRKNMLLLFIEHGLDLNRQFKKGQSLLHQFIDNFVENDHEDAVEIAEILVNSGISIQELDDQGYSPLHYSVLKENTSLISYFIEKGADVNQQSLTRGPPLYLAALYELRDVIDFLLSKNADIDVRNECGWTPMHLACYHYSEEMISFLINRGADISAEDNKGQTPLCVLKDDFDINESDSTLKNKYEQCLITLVKEFSKQVFENQFVSIKDIDLVKTKAPKHFKKSLDELKRMENIEFYPPHTFYSVLKMSINMKRLANITKNEELFSKFEENVQRFSYYRDDLQSSWESAIQV